jgi:hypothetical protein
MAKRSRRCLRRAVRSRIHCFACLSSARFAVKCPGQSPVEVATGTAKAPPGRRFDRQSPSGRSSRPFRRMTGFPPGSDAGSQVGGESPSWLAVWYPDRASGVLTCSRRPPDAG